ncbi:hypothetical protein Tdes44962_MAKER06516 [Teratosphaeria destructans]|uniref:Uncharacterized protein n=1 Tax=Teratosphaeria destructans TaxID=418781 RepID=A0A9W7T1G9_9PEZI|nr:hypothetical protein Tdes44962_MAKER06516 [Teratosphaeria destructans]
MKEVLVGVGQAVQRALRARGSNTGWLSLLGPPAPGETEHTGRKLLTGKVRQVAQVEGEWVKELPGKDEL